MVKTPYPSVPTNADYSQTDSLLQQVSFAIGHLFDRIDDKEEKKN
jgi:hypothetical protein